MFLVASLCGVVAAASANDEKCYRFKKKEGTIQYNAIGRKAFAYDKLGSLALT